MADTMPTRPLITLLAGLFALLLIPSASFAQGSMTFGVDEVQKDQEKDKEAENGGSDDGTMTFGTDEVQQDPQTDTAADQTFSLAVVAIPSDAMTREQRIELEQRLFEAVKLDPNYRAQRGDQVLQGLEEAGIGSCVTDGLCVAGIGQRAGVERILMGRVEETSRGYTLNIDLFDVSNKLIVKYTSKQGLGNFEAVLASVEPAMKEIFDIRIEREGPNYGEETDSGTVQRVLAYTAGGLAVASLAGGIYFGLEASSGEDEIVGLKDDNGQFTISQAKAQQMVRDVEGDATTANILYGASAGLAVLSGVLFYVESGSDVATPEERRRAGLLERIDVQPSIGFGEVGLGASLSF